MATKKRKFSDIKPGMCLYLLRPDDGVTVFMVKTVEDVFGRIAFKCFIYTDGVSSSVDGYVTVPKHAVDYYQVADFGIDACFQPGYKRKWYEQLFRNVFAIKPAVGGIRFHGILYSSLNELKEGTRTLVQNRRNELYGERNKLDTEIRGIDAVGERVFGMKEVPYRPNSENFIDSPTWKSIKLLGTSVYLVETKDIRVTECHITDWELLEDGSKRFKIDRHGIEFTVKEKIDSTKVRLSPDYRHWYLYTSKTAAEAVVRKKFVRKMKAALSLLREADRCVNNMKRTYERNNGKVVVIKDRKLMSIQEK